MSIGTGSVRGYFDTEWVASTAEDLSAVVADHKALTWGIPIRVVAFGFRLTEATGVATTNAVVSLDLRVTANSDTGRVEKAAITVPDSLAIGAVVVSTLPRVNVTPGLTPFVVEPGQEVVFEHKTAASGGTITGAGHYFIVYEEEPEYVGNAAVAANWVEVAS